MTTPTETREADEVENKPVTVLIPVEMHEWLRMKSYTERRSISEIVRTAVNEYRERAA